MAPSFNSQRRTDDTARGTPRGSGSRRGSPLRLALAGLVGLCWIIALEWLFGSVFALAAGP